jgi:hypothetical protein
MRYKTFSQTDPQARFSAGNAEKNGPEENLEEARRCDLLDCGTAEIRHPLTTRGGYRNIKGLHARLSPGHDKPCLWNPPLPLVLLTCKFYCRPVSCFDNIGPP